MIRIVNALTEWFKLRSRLKEETQFHLHRSSEDYRALGLSRQAAFRAARARFGGRRHIKAARRELGGDLAGLAHLIRLHRVSAAPSFPPAVVCAVLVLLLGLCPSPRLVLDEFIGQPLSSADCDASQTRDFLFTETKPSDLNVIRSLTYLSGVQNYSNRHVRAHLAQGASVTAIQFQLRAATGNPQLRVFPLFERKAILMTPAKVLWEFVAFGVLFCLWPYLLQIRVFRKWLLYAIVMAGLHCLASLVGWALAIQIWNRVPWVTDGRALIGFLLICAFHLGVIVLQAVWWWRDLQQRCPICLDGLLLSFTSGAADRLLLHSAVTESVCAHGHGVLVENHWNRRFRPQEPAFQGLVRV